MQEQAGLGDMDTVGGEEAGLKMWWYIRDAEDAEDAEDAAGLKNWRIKCIIFEFIAYPTVPPVSPTPNNLNSWFTPLRSLMPLLCLLNRAMQAE